VRERRRRGRGRPARRVREEPVGRRDRGGHLAAGGCRPVPHDERCGLRRRAPPRAWRRTEAGGDMKRLGLLVAVIGLAACGGSHAGSGGLTKAQYEQRVNRLCLVSAGRFRELHLTPTIGDYRHYASSIVHIDESFERKLAKWKPPASMASEVVAFAKAYKKVARDDKDAIAAARAGDAAK